MISVIVPVYNTEKYLEKCVYSILHQSYQNLEVILVNDGSKDRSLEVCQRLAKEDTRIQVLDCPNGGVSSARNSGMAIARGEYIAFVDSDDWLDPVMYETLRQALDIHQADIAECGFVFVPEDGSATWEWSLGDRLVESREAAMRQFASFENTVTGPCNKLYRRRVVEGVVFPPYAQAEDAVFNLNVLRNSCRRVTIPQCYYYYFQRENSGGRRTRPGHERDIILAWQEIDRSLERELQEPCYKVRRKLVDVIMRQYKEAWKFHPPHWRRLCREMKKDYIREYPRQFGAERPMSARQRLGFLIFRVSPPFYFWYNRNGK